MENDYCPVCRGNYTPPWLVYEHDDVGFWCQHGCETFSMDGSFLKDDWPSVPLKEKEAIAVCLKNRKDPKDPKPPRISKENYQAYVSEGRGYQRLLREERKECS
jgi:hypothetical protein